MAAAAILNFGKNVKNSGLDKGICIIFYGIGLYNSLYSTTVQAVITTCTVVLYKLFSQSER